MSMEHYKMQYHHMENYLKMGVGVVWDNGIWADIRAVTKTWDKTNDGREIVRLWGEFKSNNVGIFSVGIQYYLNDTLGVVVAKGNRNLHKEDAVAWSIDDLSDMDVTDVYVPLVIMATARPELDFGDSNHNRIAGDIRSAMGV